MSTIETVTAQLDSLGLIQWFTHPDFEGHKLPGDIAEVVDEDTRVDFALPDPNEAFGINMVADHMPWAQPEFIGTYYRETLVPEGEFRIDQYGNVVEESASIEYDPRKTMIGTGNLFGGGSIVAPGRGFVFLGSRNRLYDGAILGPNSNLGHENRLHSGVTLDGVRMASANILGAGLHLVSADVGYSNLIAGDLKLHTGSDVAIGHENVINPRVTLDCEEVQIENRVSIGTGVKLAVEVLRISSDVKIEPGVLLGVKIGFISNSPSAFKSSGGGRDEIIVNAGAHVTRGHTKRYDQKTDSLDLG